MSPGLTLPAFQRLSTLPMNSDLWLPPPPKPKLVSCIKSWVFPRWGIVFLGVAFPSWGNAWDAESTHSGLKLFGQWFQSQCNSRMHSCLKLLQADLALLLQLLGWHLEQLSVTEVSGPHSSPSALTQWSLTTSCPFFQSAKLPLASGVFFFLWKLWKWYEIQILMTTNKVSLGHRHTYLLTYGLWLLSQYNITIE